MTHTIRIPKSRRMPRRGTVYLTVLSVATLVSLLGITGITAARLRGRAVASSGDIIDAQNYALAAVELGRLYMSQDPKWYQNRTNGYWATQQPIGNGTYSLFVVSTASDGKLSISKDQIITGTGQKGNATQTVQVRVTPVSSNTLTCLSLAACANNNITLTAATVAGNQAIGGTKSITAASATVNCDVLGVAVPTGGTYNKAHTGGASVYTFPNSGTVFSDYTAMATAIPFSSIPTVATVATLSGMTFSSSSNPVVPTSLDPNGIYYIDCGGKTLNITGCHFIGTLILKNPGSSGSIQGSNYFEESAANGPVLIVNGNITIKTSNAAFTLGGVSYPSVFKGVTYVNGNLTTQTHPVFNGALVVDGTWNCSGAVDVNYDPTVASNPPQDFAGNTKMLVVNGSWK